MDPVVPMLSKGTGIKSSMLLREVGVRIVVYLRRSILEKEGDLLTHFRTMP